jgi:hypothetical protein
MSKKTYGAPNFMDWIAQIRAGAATVRVHFTGGALSVYGVTPAEYTTSDPFIQTVIEQSQYFKEGRITLLKTVELDTKSAASKSTKTATKSKATSTAKTEDAETPVQTESEEAPSGETLETSESEPNSKQKIEVSCLQDAQDYLQQNYGISSYKVRTRAAAQQAASEHGVEFVGAGFVSIGAAAEDEEATEDGENANLE